MGGTPASVGATDGLAPLSWTVPAAASPAPSTDPHLTAALASVTDADADADVAAADSYASDSFSPDKTNSARLDTLDRAGVSTSDLDVPTSTSDLAAPATGGGGYALDESSSNAWATSFSDGDSDLLAPVIADDFGTDGYAKFTGGEILVQAMGGPSVAEPTSLALGLCALCGVLGAVRRRALC